MGGGVLLSVGVWVGRVVSLFHSSPPPHEWSGTVAHGVAQQGVVRVSIPSNLLGTGLR